MGTMVGWNSTRVKTISFEQLHSFQRTHQSNFHHHLEDDFSFFSMKIKKFHTQKKNSTTQKFFNSIQFKKKKRNETKQTKNTNMTKLKTFWKVTSIVSIVIGLFNSIVLMSTESKIIPPSHPVECTPCSNVNNDDDDEEGEI